MALFARQPTPGDCIDRIARIVEEVPAIMQMMDTVTKTAGYEADWSDNRADARDHLTEAWYSLERALNGLSDSRREPTWGGRVATVEAQRKHIAALEKEANRLQQALAVAEARLAATEAKMAELVATQPRAGEDLATRVRRVVIWAIHPDRAANPAEREWCTALCQTLLPEIDRAMGAV
jgi:chromosome segregation ATPase